MRTLRLSAQGAPDTTADDQFLPEVVAWPIGGPYNPATFVADNPNWVYNLDVRTGTGHFLLSKDFSPIGTSSTKEYSNLWIPPVLRPFILFQTIIQITNLTYHSASAPLGPVTVSITMTDAGHGHIARISSLQVLNTDPGWSSSGSTWQWSPSFSPAGSTNLMIGAGGETPSVLLNGPGGVLNTGDKPSIISTPITSASYPWLFDEFMVESISSNASTMTMNSTCTLVCAWVP